MAAQNTVFKFVESDTGSTLEITATDDSTGVIIDLTGSTVSLRYRISGAALQTKAMTLDPSPTTGKATYKFLTTELTPGKFVGDVTITDSGSETISSLQNIIFNIKARQA